MHRRTGIAVFQDEAGISIKAAQGKPRAVLLSADDQ